jgi:hypothetical protein
MRAMSIDTLLAEVATAFAVMGIIALHLLV